ncbi:MAG TPA: choice-of-anchor D domain-containing protein [Polyangia bacterium]|jgi:iron transport multicopper oxidase|nr:choice-of-anchor D domain-containing protein [Polyangia bacterium]
MILRRFSFSVLLVLAACDVPPTGVETTFSAVTAAADPGSVMAGDVARTGWYPNQPALDPTVVGSPFFGQIFDANVDGQIYAQPLYAGGVLLVATEENVIYGLDPATGDTLWKRELGTPFRPADLNCGDLTPSVGVSGTPAIDVASNTAYLLSKTYANGSAGVASYYAHALDLSTGAERAGFPVLIAGTAANDPTRAFDAERQMQRPGLLLMNDVVYAAFGAHCDAWPYYGWVIGISTTGRVQTLFATESGSGNGSGAGIWQAGGALVSDGDGQILFATGNDWSPHAGPVPGRTPPGALGESVVRLSVQPDGTLAAADFFSPAIRDQLNVEDADFGSGAPVALPASLGTAKHPNLLAQIGKEGILYLLDRDDLGGYQQGEGGADRVVQKLGPIGNVWSKPSVWPGDGGYVYVPVAGSCNGSAPGCLVALKMGASADGTPQLAQVGTSSSSFAYGASAVVITSNGLRSGSALLWTVWSSGWSGAGGELRAYDAVPENGTLPLRYIAGIGTSAKFTTPGVGDGRVYVGTRDGHVLGFGMTGAPPLRAQGAAFPPTLVGDASSKSVQVTVTSATTIVGLGAAGDFAVGGDAPQVPLAVAAGGALSIPVSFQPSTEGAIAGALRISTDAGTFAIPLSGVGQSKAPKLVIAPAVVTFAPLVVGRASTQTVTITNVSGAPMPLTDFVPPSAPFSVSGLPDAGAALAAGDSVTVTITYAPSAAGTSSSSLSIASGEATAAVAIEGSALMGGKLRISSTALDAGTNYVGVSSTAVFQLTNEGDMPLVIEKSKPPTSMAFQAAAVFGEGTTLAAGASLEQLIVATPVVVGVNSDVWQLNANDGQGVRIVTMTVTGVAPPAPASAADPSGDVGATAMSDPPGDRPASVRRSGPTIGSGPSRNAGDLEGCSLARAPSADWAALGGALAMLAFARRRGRAR